MNREDFYMVVVDWDKKRFGVEGPITNDDHVTSSVSSAQEAGRNVNCFVSNLNSKREVINNTLNSAGFIGLDYVEEGIFSS